MLFRKAFCFFVFNKFYEELSSSDKIEGRIFASTPICILYEWFGRNVLQNSGI